MAVHSHHSHFFFYLPYSTCRLHRGPHGRPRPLVVHASVYSGSHMAHAAPSVLSSLEDIEDEVKGNMWVILHHSAVTEKSQLVAAWDRTWDHRFGRTARKALGHRLPISFSLTRLLKKDVPFLWNHAQQHSFTTLKDALTHAPVLAFPDYKLSFTMCTDASALGLGSVLMQT